MSKDEASLGFERMTVLVMLVPVEGFFLPRLREGMSGLQHYKSKVAAWC